MKKVNTKKKVKDHCTDFNLKEFQKWNKGFDCILKSLETYLETKRSLFPRFFFISNEELLQLLAEQKDPRSVERHLAKLFDNVAKLDFNQEGGLKNQSDENTDTIYGVISFEGERVQLKGCQRKNGPEIWLKTLMKNTKATVKKLIKDAFKDLEKVNVTPRSEYGVKETPRQAWVLKHCGQATSVASKTYWT
jgi:dynein heavy chain